jgi:SAM-dependent methyltransferase
MDWVRGFHAQINRWAGSAGPATRDTERADTVERLCGAEPMRILELGAGAGATSLALARRGHDVVAVDFNPPDAEFARGLVPEAGSGSLTVHEADFYGVELPGRFDAVLYWDGFGVGSYDDQRRLLKRIADDWLAPEGRAVIDVFSPDKWSWIAGMLSRYEMRSGDEPVVLRRCQDFDSVGCRYVDHWWPAGHEDERVTQTLRCYSPADFRMLLEGTGLKAVIFEAAGHPFDPEENGAELGGKLRDGGGFVVLLEAR